MATRRSRAEALGVLVALAAGAVAIVYYGAIPWALHAAVAASLWVLGYR